MKEINKKAVVEELKEFVKPQFLEIHNFSINDTEPVFEHLRLRFTLGGLKSLKEYWLEVVEKHSK